MARCVVMFVALQVHFRILPHDSYRLMYNMVPLTSGNVELPKFHLNMPRHPELVTTAVHKMLPNTVFVLVGHIRTSSYVASNKYKCTIVHTASQYHHTWWARGFFAK